MIGVDEGVTAGPGAPPPASSATTTLPAVVSVPTSPPSVEAPSPAPAAALASKALQEQLAANNALLEEMRVRVTASDAIINKLREAVVPTVQDPAAEAASLAQRVGIAEGIARNAIARAELLSLARGKFADPTDAVLALASKVEVDLVSGALKDPAAAQLAMDAMLEAKPHWRSSPPAAAVYQSAGPPGGAPVAPAPTAPVSPRNGSYSASDMMTISLLDLRSIAENHKRGQS